MFVVLFTDNAERSSERERNMPAHLEFLKAHAEWIQAAGPLVDTADGNDAGGMWLVQVGNRSEVEALVHADPLWSTGLRKAVRILTWRRVFAEGEALNAVTARPALNPSSANPE